MKAWQVVTGALVLALLAIKPKAQAGGSGGTTGGSLATCADATVQPWAPEIVTAAPYAGVPPELLAALVYQESKGVQSASRYEPGATWAGSPPAAAQALGWTQQLWQTSLGLTQVMGVTAWKSLGFHYAPSQVFDPLANLKLGARYLRKQFDTYGDWQQALSAYNSGSPTGAPVYASAVWGEYQRILGCMGR